MDARNGNGANLWMDLSKAQSNLALTTKHNNFVLNLCFNFVLENVEFFKMIKDYSETITKLFRF